MISVITSIENPQIYKKLNNIGIWIRNNQSNLILLLLLILGVLINYYHCFGVNSTSYGSGDAFGLVLSSTNLEKNPHNYLITYIYRIFYEITGLNTLNFSFYFTPILSSILIVFIFKILEKNANICVATISCFLIITNPWISFYSTEPSKALFVVLYFIISLFFMYRYKLNKDNKDIIFSFVFISFASIFYHAALMFYPPYLILLCLNIDKKRHDINIKYILWILLLFSVVFMLLSFPFYALKYHSANIERDNKTELTEIGEMGLFERYISAMHSAMLFPENLGYKRFLDGINNFLVFDWVWVLSIIIIIILLFMHLLNINICPILIDFIFIILFISIFISLQWVASSHGTRYPMYVVLFLFIIIGYFIDIILKKIKVSSSHFVSIVFVSILIISPFSLSYTFNYVEGLRHIYIPQLQTGDLIKINNITINQENQALYLGWPAITLSLKNIQCNDDYFHTFGWGNQNLSIITSSNYIHSHNITYYIFDRTGTDYHNSSEIVLERLNETFDISFIDKTERKNMYTAIYKIGDLQEIHNSTPHI